MMKLLKLFVPFISLLLFGCASLVHYNSNIDAISSKQDALIIIDRAYFQQPIKHQPKAIAYNLEYLKLSFGNFKEIQTKGFASTTALGNASTNFNSDILLTSASVSAIAGARTMTTEQIYEKNERIYFDSIKDMKIYSKRNYYIVDINTSGGKLLDRVYVYSKEDAVQFISALEYLKNLASA